MKKMFSVIFSLVLGLFIPLCNISAQAVCCASEDIVTCEKKKDSTLNLNGIKNVVDHPFRIIFRAFGWAILGAFVPDLFFTGCSSTIGACCGAISKAIELYCEGCTK